MVSLSNAVKFAVALFMSPALSACATETFVHVILYPENKPPSAVSVTGSLIVDSAKGRRIDRILAVNRNGKLTLDPGDVPGQSVWLRSRSPMTVKAAGYTTVVASGALLIRKSGSGICVVLMQPLEDYVARVVSREMPSEWPPEALKAQAVVSRSFVMAARRRHYGQRRTVCSLTHCQLWSAGMPTAQSMAAAQATCGVVLCVRGQPAEACFTSACGGWTADGATSGLPNWLKQVRDGSPGNGYCRASNHFNWRSFLTSADLSKIFGISGGSGGRIAFRVLSQDKAGRVTSVSATGIRTAVMTGSQFLVASGRVLGWAKVKSCLFTVKPSAGGYILTGHGLGHGAGMCQWGARGRAAAGRGWREILSAYFPNAQLKRL